VLDLESNRLTNKEFAEAVKHRQSLPLEMFATYDRGMAQRARDAGIKDIFAWTLTFDKLLRETNFAADMRTMLAILEEAYQCPVDTEFTVNFFEPDHYKINLLQCRPLQLKGGSKPTGGQAEPDAKDIVLASSGPVIGQNRLIDIDCVLYVSPAQYAKLTDNERHSIARLIGSVVHSSFITSLAPSDRQGGNATIMLIGPGRWGTSTPSLGVPVTFAEINRVSVICEIAEMRADFVADVSLGTHFFSDLIEMEMLYLGIEAVRPGNTLKKEFFENSENLLEKAWAGSGKWQHVVRVIKPLRNGKGMRLYADTVAQKVLCYFSGN
jgi:hypothetical protein